MNKLFSFFICFLAPVMSYGAYYELTNDNIGSGLTYKVTDSIKQIWGNPQINPTYIQDKSSGFGDFRIKDGFACCGDTSGDTAQNNKDDQAIIAFVANNISEHGAEFCLTQIHVASSNTYFPMMFQQPNWPGLPCAWFCEPGWDGLACKDQTNTESACNTTDYKSAIDALRNSSPYQGNDSIKWSKGRMGVAEYIAILDATWVNNFYVHNIVVGATKFNEHGIEAEPILLSAVGDHPATTWLQSSSTTTGIKKVLCAQGFTKDDKCSISSKNCGADIFCSAEDKKNFNKSKGHTTQINGICTAVICSDGSKALDSSYNCVACGDTVQSGKCSVLGDNSFGKCIKCPVGQYFDNVDCTCKDARRLGTDALKYGNNRTEAATLQCWSLVNMEKFQECVLNTTDANNTSSAVDTFVAKISSNRLLNNAQGLAVAEKMKAKMNGATSDGAIRDTDMASEMLKYSQNSILQQAGNSMLQQAAKQQ
nr:hypothetical protein [Candidatus Enterousia merdequi]